MDNLTFLKFINGVASGRMSEQDKQEKEALAQAALGVKTSNFNAKLNSDAQLKQAAIDAANQRNLTNNNNKVTLQSNKFGQDNKLQGNKFDFGKYMARYKAGVGFLQKAPQFEQGLGAQPGDVAIQTANEANRLTGVNLLPGTSQPVPTSPQGLSPSAVASPVAAPPINLNAPMVPGLNGSQAQATPSVPLDALAGSGIQLPQQSQPDTSDNQQLTNLPQDGPVINPFTQDPLKMRAANAKDAMVKQGNEKVYQGGVRLKQTGDENALKHKEFLQSDTTRRRDADVIANTQGLNRVSREKLGFAGIDAQNERTKEQIAAGDWRTVYNQGSQDNRQQKGFDFKSTVGGGVKGISSYYKQLNDFDTKQNAMKKRMTELTTPGAIIKNMMGAPQLIDETKPNGGYRTEPPKVILDKNGNPDEKKSNPSAIQEYLKLKDSYENIDVNRKNFQDSAPSPGALQTIGKAGSCRGNLACADSVRKMSLIDGLPTPPTSSAGVMEGLMPRYGWSQLAPGEMPQKKDVLFEKGTGPSGRHVQYVTGPHSVAHAPGGKYGNIVIPSVLKLTPDTTIWRYNRPKSGSTKNVKTNSVNPSSKNAKTAANQDLMDSLAGQ